MQISFCKRLHMISLDDVAKLAQVSPATVSRALSRPEMVAETTRKRILQAAQELGYQPNQLARSLRQRSSQTLGLVITDILNPFHATLAKGVQDAAEKHNYTVFLFNTDEDPEKELRALNVVAQPTYELGFLACETLLSSLSRGQDTLPTSIRLDTSFILRESTAPPAVAKMGSECKGGRARKKISRVEVACRPRRRSYA